jgi:hypothetical protein
MYFTIPDFKQHILVNGIAPLSPETAEILVQLEKSLDVAGIESSIQQFQRTHATSNYGKKDASRDASRDVFSSLKKDRQDITNIQKIPRPTGGGGNSTATNAPVKLDEKWVKYVETTGAFKPTKLETKEGIEKTINEIRNHLNKITKKNFETQKEKIFLLIEEIIKLSNEEKNEDPPLAKVPSADSVTPVTPVTHLQKIAQFIFDISSSNKFFCELYANLYKELIVHYNDIFISTLNEFIAHFKESIQTFSYCDPNEDYEKYCVFVKESDKKKSITTFIIMLLNRDVIQADIVVEITEYFQRTLQTFMEEPNRINEIEELGEILYILVSLGNGKIGTSIPAWNAIIQTIQIFTTLKVKEHKSLSSRFLFKMKDLLKDMETGKK